MWRSVRQTPHASTAIATSPAPGSAAGDVDLAQRPLLRRRRPDEPHRPHPETIIGGDEARIDALLADYGASPPHAREPRLPRRGHHAHRLRRARPCSHAFPSRGPGRQRGADRLAGVYSSTCARAPLGLAVTLAGRAARPRRPAASATGGSARRRSSWAGSSRPSATPSTRRTAPPSSANLVHLLVGPAYLVNEALRIRPVAKVDAA